MSNAVVWKAFVLHFLEDPDSAPANDAYEYFEDGALLVVDGHVLMCGAAKDVMKDLPPRSLSENRLPYCGGSKLV